MSSFGTPRASWPHLCSLRGLNVSSVSQSSSLVNVSLGNHLLNSTQLTRFFLILCSICCLASPACIGTHMLEHTLPNKRRSPQKHFPFQWYKSDTVLLAPGSQKYQSSGSQPSLLPLFPSTSSPKCHASLHYYFPCKCFLPDMKQAWPTQSGNASISIPESSS